MPFALEAQSLNHWTAKKVLLRDILNTKIKFWKSKFICSNIIIKWMLKKCKNWTSLVSPVVKNPTANAGDVGSMPGQVRSHIWGNGKAWAPQLLTPASSRVTSNSLRLERNLCCPQPEKALKDPVPPETNNFISKHVNLVFQKRKCNSL